MSTTSRSQPRFRVGDWVSFFFGPQIIKGQVVEDRGVFGVRRHRLYRVCSDPNQGEPISLEIPEEDLKTATPPDEERPRQAFKVTYVRQGRSDTWLAETKWKRTYHKMMAKGVVAYSSARWEGETARDENSAVISVMLESDPRLGQDSPLDQPSISKEMATRARELADEVFKNRHPEATIEHREVEGLAP